MHRTTLTWISFFDYDRGKFGLYELIDVKEAMARILGHKTAIITRDSLHRALHARIGRAQCRCSDAEALGDVAA